MESFAIWNLLKTALSTAQAPSPTSSANGEESEISEATSEEKAKNSPTQSDSSPHKENACEAYFLRHEKLSQKHGKP